MEAVVVRRKGEMKRRVMILAATVMVVAACAVVVSSYKSSEAAAPNVESMYHMWLGPNGLPLSPRKQRGLLFQFCTTNFVSFIISFTMISAAATAAAALPPSSRDVSRGEHLSHVDFYYLILMCYC